MCVCVCVFGGGGGGGGGVRVGGGGGGGWGGLGFILFSPAIKLGPSIHIRSEHKPENFFIPQPEH